jgi:hypothetical protein
MYNLQRFLVDYDMTMLRALAQNRGARLVTNRQAEAADELAKMLLDSLSVRTALARLSPAAREALDTLLAAYGRMRAPHFARRFGQVRPIGPGRMEREVPWQDPSSPAEELWYAGLIFGAFHQDEGGPGEFIFVPEDLKAILPPPQIEPAGFEVETIVPPAHKAGSEMNLVPDLFTYLVYLQTHDVRTYADSRWSQHDRDALSGQLADSSERRLSFLRHLAERMGLVVRQAEHLRLEATAVRRWLTAPSRHQLAALQDAWRDDPDWNDLCRVPGLVCDQATPWRNDPIATRRALLALLARCPLGEWWTISSFVAVVKEIHPDFQRPDGDYASWYIRDVASGEYLSGFESWDRVEGALIADLFTGLLTWLAVIDTATAEAGVVCRLSDAGAHWLELVPEAVEEQPSPPITIRPDLIIELPPPASLYTRFQLERFADLAGLSPPWPSLEPIRYHLSAGSVGRALSRDIRVEQLLAFLQQASERPIPANVVGQLRLWADRFGQAHLEEVALLRVKNERVLKELTVLPETRSLIGQILSPTSALVRKKDLPRLRKELRALGYLPLDETGGGSS